MNWKDIKVSADNTQFLLKGEPIFNKKFIEVLKFHEPGLAPVLDENGAYHIDSKGIPLYIERYQRTFGFYCCRAAVINNNSWFHITENGKRAYNESYAWTGNYQENICTVRDFENHYFHIDLDGNRLCSENYLYAGDFKDGFSCVKKSNGYYIHIDTKGQKLHKKEFLDLGIFHKNFATAKDENGWHHIDKLGNELYSERYESIEPFYNGFALVTYFDSSKIIIDENGGKVIVV
jgi:hypothetical protein